MVIAGRRVYVARGMSDSGRKRPGSRPPELTHPAIGRTPTPHHLPATRTTTPQQPYSPHPIGTPLGTAPLGVSRTAGALAVGAWLRDRGIYQPTGNHWRVQIALELNDRPASFMFAATRFQITIAPDSWGFVFGHGDRISTIHVASIASARDQDEHRLLAMTPPLRRVGTLLRDLEARYRMFFPRHHAAVRSDISASEPMIRAWIASF